ncbi:T9SS type A sorting domain-containing protein, partial [Ferruginibacter sp.]|uniref:T9SS type A sorting domain-containing protein n=1 Tax=Ferruginibacter sp. TaxID=1940288 RepID=UPI00199982FA
TVYGTGANAGGALTLTSPLTFANNSNLVWNRDGGTLPATTVFSAGSTFSIIGTGNGSSTSQLPGITAGTAFHHVIINAPNCKASNPNFGGNLNTINGNLTILSTGIVSSKIRFLNGATQVANISGDLIINPPLGSHVTFILYSTATIATAEAVNIGGNLVVNNNFPTSITGTNGTYAIGSTAVTLSGANPAIIVGMGVTGSGIASGSYVTAISGTSLTLSVVTTAAGTAVPLSFVQATANLQLTDNNGTNSQTYVKGNITFNTATLSNSGTGLGAININRTDGVPQIYTRNGGSISGSATWNVMANAVFDLGASVLPGAAFTLNAGATLRSGSATGLLANITAGTKNFSSAANYIFNGTAAQTTLNNFTATTPTANQVNNLTISNAAGVTLGNILIVANATTLMNGKLTLGAANLITNSITGSTNSYVVTNAAGFLKVNNVGAVNTLFPVGISASSYTPVVLNNSGAVDNYSVRMVTGAPAGINTSPQVDSSVNITWDIVEDVAGGSNAAITMQWNTTNQNNFFNSNNCAVVHSTGTAIDYSGAYVAATNPSAGVYSVTGTGFTAFSPFGVTSKAGSVLPLTLLSFKALKKNKNVRLDWTTSNEINTKKFLVERTTDLQKFDVIKEVNASGILNVNNYTALDENALKGISYYRLKIIDNNGQFFYSKIAKVFFADTKAMFVSPNPVVNIINVEHAPAGKNALFTVYSIEGKKLITYVPTALSSQTSINVNLIAGTYLLYFTNNGAIEKTVIVKK